PASAPDQHFRWARRLCSAQEGALGKTRKPWRILMVAPTPFFADRGCHVRILGEAQALIELGNEVKICTYPLGRDVPGIPTERTLPVPWYRKLSAGPSVHHF